MLQIFATPIVKKYYDVTDLIFTFGAFLKTQKKKYGKRSF